MYISKSWSNAWHLPVRPRLLICAVDTANTCKGNSSHLFLIMCKLWFVCWSWVVKHYYLTEVLLFYCLLQTLIQAKQVLQEFKASGSKVHVNKCCAVTTALFKSLQGSLSPIPSCYFFPYCTGGGGLKTHARVLFFHIAWARRCFNWLKHFWLTNCSFWLLWAIQKCYAHHQQCCIFQRVLYGKYSTVIHLMFTHANVSTNT